MNNQETINQQPDNHSAAQLTDLSVAPARADEIKGGPTTQNIRNVRIKTTISGGATDEED